MAFVKTGDPLMDTILLIWEILKWGIPCSLLLSLVIAKIRWKRFPLEAVIIEKRGSNLIKLKDRVGKFMNNGITGYKLAKAKDTIPVVDFKWVIVNADKPNNILEKIVSLLRPTMGTIFFFRYGTKQYKPIDVTENGKYKRKYQEVKDKNGEPIYVYSYEQIDPRDKLKTLNFEVVDWDNMNFAVQEHRASYEKRKKSGEFWKQAIIPIAIFLFTIMLCIIVIKLSFDYASEVRGGSNQPVGDTSSNTKTSTPFDGILPGQ